MLAGNQGYNAGLKTLMDQQKENLQTNAILQNYQRQNAMLDYAQKIMSDPTFGGGGQSQGVPSAWSGAPGGQPLPQSGADMRSLLPGPTPQQRLARVGLAMGLLKQDPSSILAANEQLNPKGVVNRPNSALTNPYTGEQLSYNPEAPPGSYFDQQSGRFLPIPGYGDIVANNIRTQESAKAPYTFVDKYDPVTKQMIKVPLSSVTPAAPAMSAPPVMVPPYRMPQPQMPVPMQPSPGLLSPQPMGTQPMIGQGQPPQPGMQIPQPSPQDVTGPVPQPQQISGPGGHYASVGVNSSLPSRTLSGFPSGPALSEATEQKGIGEANAGVYKNVLAQGAAAHETMNSVSLLDSLYQDGLNTGNFTPLKTKAAALIKSAGMDPSSFMLADPKNATAYEKATIQMGFQFARSNLPGQRITQQEVSTALKANPNVTNPNDTNQLLQAVIYGGAAYKDNMQNVIDMYRDQNKGSVNGFQQWYNQHYNVMDFYRGAYKDGVWVQPPQSPQAGSLYNMAPNPGRAKFPDGGWVKYMGNGQWQPQR